MTAVPLFYTAVAGPNAFYGAGRFIIHDYFSNATVRALRCVLVCRPRDFHAPEERQFGEPVEEMTQALHIHLEQYAPGGFGFAPRHYEENYNHPGEPAGASKSAATVAKQREEEKV